MPTNAELGREFELLKTRLDWELESRNERLLEAIKSEVGKAVMKEVQQITNGMTYMNSVFEELSGKCGEVFRDNMQLRAENAYLNSTNDKLHTVINRLKQHFRSSNIEIRGILIIKDEDCIMILHNIGTEIDCPLVTSNIDIIHRVPTADRTQTKLQDLCRELSKSN